MFETLLSSWMGLSAGIQAAVIGAFTSVATATLGATVVLWQIGRQARNSIAQNRRNEALKLKLEVYKEIIKVCESASLAEIDLSTYVRLFQSSVQIATNLQDRGLPFSVPGTRVPLLIQKKHDADMRAVDIIGLVERWGIVDRRMGLFRTAMNVAKHDATEAYQKFFNAALLYVPHEIPGHPTPGTTYPWQPPNRSVAQNLHELADRLLDALSTQASYISDFQLEMQNLLLSELFDSRMPAREPIDPKYFAVRLDRYDDINRYFETETAWGREKKRIQNEVRTAARSNSHNVE